MSARPKGVDRSWWWQTPRRLRKRKDLVLIRESIGRKWRIIALPMAPFRAHLFTITAVDPESRSITLE